MKTMIVSHISNWEQDSEGNYLFDEDGTPILIDDSALGMVLKSHVLPISSIDPATNQLKTELLHRLEVVWEQSRSPATTLTDPSDLVFISLPEDSEEEDDDDSDFEDNPDHQDEHHGERDVNEHQA